MSKPLDYRPEALAREMRPFYIGASEQDIQDMLTALGLKNLDELYSHISPELLFRGPLKLPKAMGYQELITHVNRLAEKNHPRISFMSDGLPFYRVQDVVGPVCAVRGLTTAYTPYQPERSQGTLQSLWIYQSLLSQLTGFEAINASLYDRSTCLYEALLCAQRLVKNSQIAIVAATLHPNDREVLRTQALGTGLSLLEAPLDPQSGTLDLAKLKELLQVTTGVAAVAYPQVNCLGNLEDVDALTDLSREFNVKSIAVVDPMLLAALKPPVQFGTHGSDMVVAEGQHLAIAPNFGGPGLGVFGIRLNEGDKNSIRATAGRYVGKARDDKGRECKALILSTREQHIRRDKATSNICSNQSFVATLAGAALLARGDEGMSLSCKVSHDGIRAVMREITRCPGVTLRFPKTTAFNEVTLALPVKTASLIQEARAHNLHIGVDVSQRFPEFKGENLLLLAVTDVQDLDDLQTLVSFFHGRFGASAPAQVMPEIPKDQWRGQVAGIPHLPTQDIVAYYQKLGAQNLSPDDGLYPLGSCTMKYNPYINDYAASLPGFTDLHPAAPLEDAQGSLEVLYETQEGFKAITGLAAVTTQPVAGAQGELVGLKMIQAYHADRGEADTRKVLLIPRSAHGTNPATATMAGYNTIVLLEASSSGEINLQQLKDVVAQEGKRIAGVMVTNPNTGGVFETGFAEMAKIIHGVGGLVYMDGANMNAIAGRVNLGALGVDAVHNNLHKTWTIPHGGGGPGDAIVAVSARLQDYLPGHQVVKNSDGQFALVKPSKSVGSFHRHFGNFAHKVRAHAYVKALGAEGVPKMSAVSVLCARYLFHKLSPHYPVLPAGSQNVPRMHEFILTLSPQTFARIEDAGVLKAQAIARIGKLFLDFGFHAPTVAFPEQFGLMIEPTETYGKAELDQFAEVVTQLLALVREHPEVLQTVPHFTPIDRVDEVTANKTPVLAEKIGKHLPEILPDRVDVAKLRQSTPGDLCQMIVEAHRRAKA